MSARGVKAAIVVAVSLVVPASAQGAHFLLDHPAPDFSPPAGLPSSTINSGGPGAQWELIDTITTGNPHTDLDFFTSGGNTYASVGTLGAGPNGGGQSIVQLTNGGEVSPALLTQHPSASCLSNPSAATGLQHDVEAAPKGGAILNTPNPYAVRTDTQLLIDASDAAGRCHDQGLLGIQNAPRGGLELIDVTDVANPVEIGLTSHAGQAHTVNVDPKRPHIAYVSTSDAVTVTDGVRQNEIAGSGDANDLDGFEVVDYSSCMNFPAGTSVDDKRTACLPQVYRYRYASTAMALGHTVQSGGSAIFGCHELELYPDDKLTCGGGSALIVLDMSGAFDDMGTPTDYSDDKPRGTPLPCQVRPSSSVGPFATGAQVTDCVDGTGTGTTDLNVPNWLAAGAPSLTGVTHVGSVHHQGGGPGQAPALPPLNSLEDLAFDHEAEFSGSGQHLIATDERGGGILPPGATCSPVGDNLQGNGGVHFYKTSALTTTGPGTPQQAQKAYAKTPDGDLAIFRAPIRTQARGTVCTAHVFQQIPGENRIFMAWYSQGTQVIDFVENPDGTVRFASAGWFIPENANEWVSAVFKAEQGNGSSTYWGATGDFNLGEAGRNSVDVYKVTLPPAPQVVGAGGGGGGGGEAGRCAQDIRGTKTGDRLLGSIAGDRIAGRGGNDQINGRSGEDCVRGGAGEDRLRGGTMNDEVKGGRGADRLKGNGGKDKLADRSGGRDRLNGGAGGDRLRANGGGRDLVRCGGGRDRAVVDRADRVRGCERVKRPKRG